MLYLPNYINHKELFDFSESKLFVSQMLTSFKGLPFYIRKVVLHNHVGVELMCIISNSILVTVKNLKALAYFLPSF